MDIVLLGSLLIFLSVFWFFYSRFFGAEYYPTTKRKMQKMIEFAKLRKKDVAYDLGSGDGRLVIAAAGKCRKAVGVEIDLLRVFISLVKIKVFGLKNARIILGDIFKQDFKDANVVFLFLKQGANDKLQNKLAKLKKGTRIVSHYWTFSGWNPIKKDEKLKIYLYIIGKNIKIFKKPKSL